MTARRPSGSAQHPQCCRCRLRSLKRTDAESVRVFLRAYDQYLKEMEARALQVGVDDASGAGRIRPISVKFCVNAGYLESSIALGFISGASSYEDLTDEVLIKFLEEKSAESKDTVTLATLDALVYKKLKMDMRDRSAKSRMQGLCIAYHTMLRDNGLSWVLKSNQRTAVTHVLSAIKPDHLRSRLIDDLDFAGYDLRKDFTGFLKHAVKVAEAFQIVDSVRRTTGSNTQAQASTASKGGGSSSKTPTTAKAETKTEPKPKKDTPACPFHVCHKANPPLKHWIRDCPSSTDVEKDQMKAKIKADKEKDAPAFSTRAKKDSEVKSKKDDPKPPGNVGRLTEVDLTDNGPTCNVTLQDGLSALKVTGRCDDGSDGTLASRKTAEAAVIAVIGRMAKTEPVVLQVALRKGEEADSFTFSRTWTVPRTIFHLPSGQLAMIDISYLVADDELACENVFIARPILEHLKIDTATMLDKNRRMLDGTDCSMVGNRTVPKRGGFVSRVMTARSNSIPNDFLSDPDLGKLDPCCPRAEYNFGQMEEDPFPNPTLLDIMDSDQADEIHQEVEATLTRAKDAGIPEDAFKRLADMVMANKDVFRTKLSSGPPADLPPLRIELMDNAALTKVRLRNYSHEQKAFINDFVTRLVEKSMAYPNPKAEWAAAPLLVPKPGPARFRFTVDLRPVNKYTKKHQYPMPILEQELCKLTGSRFFANFDLSHGYWQLPLHKDSQATQSFLTPENVYIPTRVLHGTTNAVAHLQASLSEIIPEHLAANILKWLDDILLYEQSLDRFLNALVQLLQLCVKYRLRLHPKKCTLFAKEVRWCGRLITEKGIKFDHKRMSTLQDMQAPENGQQLQQFICVLQWVKSAIPNFARLTEPLHLFMEKVYEASTSRNKTAVARVQLSLLGLNDEHKNEFEECRRALAHQITLVHRDPNKRLSVYTDASDVIWSGVVTQVPVADMNKPHADKRHEPLTFLSGRFDDRQSRRSIIEKEAFAILASLHRMH